MLVLRFLNKVGTIAAVGGVLALTQVATPTLVTSAPPLERMAHCGYAAAVVTATELSLDVAVVQAGETAIATARVTSGDSTPSGQVVFRVEGRGGVTVPLSAGTATWTLPVLAPGDTYTVTARFRASDHCLLPSADEASLTVQGGDEVAGEEGQRDEGEGVVGRPAPSGDAAGKLPSVGTDQGMLTYGLLGAGLLTLGAAVLLRRRHRVRA